MVKIVPCVCSWLHQSQAVAPFTLDEAVTCYNALLSLHEGSIQQCSLDLHVIHHTHSFLLHYTQKTDLHRGPRVLAVILL